MNKAIPFHHEYLQLELTKRVHKNPHYSLRSFARDLGVTAGWLSEFLSFKKGMSVQKAKEISQSLGLTLKEQEVFVLSAQAAHARKREDKSVASQQLKAYKLTKTFKFSNQDFVEAGAWYHQAILELIETDDFSHRELEISQRLRLPMATVVRALKELQNIGMLEIRNGKMLPAFEETQTEQGRPSRAIKKYHEEILQKATSALHEQPIDEREFISVTFAFDAERILEAKEELRKMQKAFTDKFYGNGSAKNSVHQFSLQLFRLDNKGNKS